MYQSSEEKHFAGPDLITDIVVGLSDGLIVPFALAAGLSGAIDSVATIITAGLVAVTAGSVSMGLGGYFTGRAEIEEYHSGLKQEQDKMGAAPGRDVFAEMGLSQETRDIISEEMSRDKDKWMEFMTRYELDLDKPDPRRARNSAFNIGFSYIAGGLIPLSPYFFADHPMEGLKWSCLVTVACLFVFGFFKAKFTGQNPWGGAIRVTLIGSVAATAAFFIARLF